MRFNQGSIMGLLVFGLFFAGCEADGGSGGNAESNGSADITSGGSDNDGQLSLDVDNTESSDLTAPDLGGSEDGNSGVDVEDVLEPVDTAVVEGDTSSEPSDGVILADAESDGIEEHDGGGLGDDAVENPEPDAGGEVTSWVPISLEMVGSGVTASLYGAWIDAEGTLWVVGYGVLRSLDDTGWTDHMKDWPGNKTELTTVSGHGDLVAVADNAFVYRKDNDAWTEVFYSDNCAGNIDLFVLPTSTMIVGCPYYSGLGRVNLATGEGAEAMSTDMSAMTRDVWAFDDNDVYVLSASDAELRHYTGGQWSDVASWPGVLFDKTFKNYNAITGTKEGDIIVVGNDGKIVRINGTNVMFEDSGTPFNLNDVASSDDGTLIAIGEAGTVKFNVGNGWKALLPVNKSHLNALTGIHDGVAYAVGGQGTIVRIVFEPVSP